ncbi:TRAP transporter large permease subunit [Rhabdaerophilum sp. SD176]|uniref:TRAP transporter large permease n=1 Tax=Rhabdaerophilum sp. SD176 TaxID=2983548 RepID=UPI0024E00463|nr:TRAP transporter large permease subunit [Rhabdaerophilum sp. SD176]
MDPATASLFLIGLMFLCLGTGVWIGLGLGFVGYFSLAFISGKDPSLSFATTIWGSMNSWTLTALPMFIWMGEILFRSSLSDDMFKGLAPWMQRLPGRLLHTNVFGCGIFAAISGSSAATAATIGRMTIPELRKRGYDDFMNIGSLAGSGTLGLLIPPSIILIVYGVAAEVSIARLFIAGILPGIVLMLVFSGVLITWALMNPSKVPPPDAPMTFSQKLNESRRLIPIVGLIVIVLGSIYTGIATPTESAVLGVVGSLLLTVITGTFSWKMLNDSVMGAVRTNAMIGIILAGASFLTVAMGFTGLPRIFAEWINTLGLTQFQLILALMIVYMILGCLIDGISMVVLTAAVVMPAVKAVGIDLVWFGIFVVLVVEMAQITPPVGFNLFVLQGLTGRSMGYIALAALPFFLAMVAMVFVVILVPDLVTWLPNQMLGQK